MKHRFNTRSLRILRRHEHGLTLVELMVAMMIGLFLALGSITVFNQSRSSYRTSDSQARLQENLRFVLDTLEPDIRLARFWGLHNEPALVNVPGGIIVNCGAVNATALATTLNREVAAVDESVGYAVGVPCPASSVARPDSDVLIVRHVSQQPAVPTAGRLQVRSDLATADLFNTGVNPAGYGPLAQTHDLVVNVYYVDNGSNLDPTLPSLRRWTLNAAGSLVDEEMIAGVENLQVQFGVDENGPDVNNLFSITRYVDGDHPIITPGAAGFLPNAEIVAVRLWALMRTEQTEVGMTDLAVYTPLDGDLAPINPGGAAYPPNVRRQQITKTIHLRNNR